jgi:hypothetical protein
MLLVRDLADESLAQLLRRYALRVERIAVNETISGSYWGESEAGLIGDRLIVRDDTPVHSALHEASHFVCMDESRRACLQRDAGGDHGEENAVCYLQILLALFLPPMTGARMQTDMDAWGYTFRLGSARTWFEQDADDARQWLQRHDVIDAGGSITWR